MARPRPITIGTLVNIDGSLTQKGGYAVELPDDFITQTSAILATKRSGKSNAAVVIAEELYARGLPFVAVDIKGDWWGIRAEGPGGPGLDIPIFGGHHGDLKIDPAAGKMFATLIAGQRLTCLIDVSDLDVGDRNRFLKDFFNELYKVNTEPLLVIIEEAEQVAPQLIEKSEGNAPALLGAINRMIKLGGQRGLGVLLVSQRSGSLNKNSLSQIETLIVLRTAHQLDRKAVDDWISGLDTDHGYAIVDRMRTLANGQAFIISPYFMPTFTDAPAVQLVQFRRRHTFDSGETPKVGESRPAARMADVDLQAISAEMAQALEISKANDPAELREQIAGLNASLHAARGECDDWERRYMKGQTRVEVQEVPMLTDTDRKMLELAQSVFANGVEAAMAYLDAFNTSIAKLIQANATPTPRMAAAPPVSRETKRSTIDVAYTVPPPEDLVLPKGAQRMVESLGRLHPLKATISQWGLAAKLKTSGGTWGTYLSKIRVAGLIEETNGLYTLSPLGFAHIGGVPTALTAAELQDQVRESLGRNSGATRMLDVLLNMHPQGLNRAELAEAAQITMSGGSFGTYLSRLRANGMVTEFAGEIVATDFLVYGPAAA